MSVDTSQSLLPGLSSLFQKGGGSQRKYSQKKKSLKLLLWGSRFCINAWIQMYFSLSYVEHRYPGQQMWFPAYESKVL
jgi:hypothetical protein